MARIIKKPGNVFEFPTEGGEHGYCQWLPHLARVFKISTKDHLTVEAALELPEAFAVVVFNDTPNRYGWHRIGSGAFPEQYEDHPWFAKQDILTGKITKYRAGREEPATFDEIKNLETVAAWAHPHIVERLLANLRGVESAFLRSVSVKPLGAEPVA